MLALLCSDRQQRRNLGARADGLERAVDKSAIPLRLLVLLRAATDAAHQNPPQPGVFRKDEKGARPSWEFSPRRGKDFPKRLARIVRYRRGIERPPLNSDHRGVPPDIGRRPPDLLIAGGHRRSRWGQATGGGPWSGHASSWR